MNKNKNSLTVLRFRQKKESRDIINKIEIKPLIIPYIGIQDDSTISHVKRIGGQILQLYSLHVMDVRTGGKDVFYYLLSNLYPLNVEEDSSKHRLASIEIEVYKTKVIKSFKENFAIQGGAFIDSDVYKAREYTYIPAPLESIETSAGMLNFDIIDFIRYTTISSGVESFTSVSAGLIGLDLISFPFLYKDVEEISTSAMTTIEIEVI